MKTYNLVNVITSVPCLQPIKTKAVKLSTVQVSFLRIGVFLDCGGGGGGVKTVSLLPPPIFS